MKSRKQGFNRTLIASSMCGISTFGVCNPCVWICDVILLNHSFCSSLLKGCNCSAKNVRTSLKIWTQIQNIRQTGRTIHTYDRVRKPFSLNTAAISLLSAGIVFIFFFSKCIYCEITGCYCPFVSQLSFGALILLIHFRMGIVRSWLRIQNDITIWLSLSFSFFS